MQKSTENLFPEDAPQTPQKAEKPYLWRLQWILCADFLAAALLCRFVAGGDLYTQVHAWYEDQMQNEVLPQEQWETWSETVLTLFPSASSPSSQAADTP